MSLDQITKTNIAYKALLGKAHTENIKGLSNEAEGSFLNLPSSKIFVDEIDPDPTVAVLDGIVLLITADLIEDNTSNGHAFFAVYTQDIVSLGVSAGDRVKNAISPAFGFKYEAKPYEQTTNNKISIDDPRSWVYQYEAGVFYQQNIVATKPATIELYVYKGTTLIDIGSRKANTSGNNIESKIFSKNLLTNITTDLDIYVSSIGDDSSGDGTESLPYLTLEKVLTLLSFSTISNNSTITIHLSSNSFEITSFVVDLFSTINFKDNSSIVFKGSDLILSKTLTGVLPDFLIPFKYNVTGLTETSLDYYRGCFVKNNDNNYFPVASSGNGFLYTQKSLTFTTVYNLTSTITSSLIDPFGVLSKGVKEGAISFKNILFDFSNNIEVYSELGCSFKFDTCFFNKNITFFSDVNLNSQYTVFKSLEFKTNGLVNAINSSITDFKAGLTDYNDKVLENIILYKNNSNFDYIIDSNCLIKGDSLVKSGVGLLQVFKLQEKIVGENIWTELDSATELIQFINNKNVTFVFDDIQNYKLTNDQITSLGDVSLKKFILSGNINKEYFNSHLCGFKLKTDIAFINYPIVFCRENNKIYKYVASSSYTPDNEHVLNTSDGGSSRYVSVDYNQIKIDNNGDVVDHTGTPITNIKTANIDSNSLAIGLVDNDKLATQGYVEQFVNTTLGAIVSLQGDWDANTDSPSIVEATTAGYAWRVSVNGATNLGGITDWKIGDLAVKTATGWLKIDNEDISALWGNITGDVLNQTDLIDYINSVLPSTMTLTVHNETELASAIAAVNSASLSGTILFKNNISLSSPKTYNLESITLDLNNYFLIQNTNLLSISGQSFALKNGRLVWDSLVYNDVKHKNDTGVELLGVGSPNSVSLSAVFDNITFTDYIGVDLIDNDIPCMTIPNTSGSAGSLTLSNCYFLSNTGAPGGADTLINSPFVIGAPVVNGFTFNVFNYKGMFEKSGDFSKCVKLLVTTASNKIYMVTDGSVNITNTIVGSSPSAGQAVIDYPAIPLNGIISLSVSGVGALINYRPTLVDLTGSEVLVQKNGVLYKIPVDSTLAAYLSKSQNLNDVENKQTALNNLTGVSNATNEFVLTKDTDTGNVIWKAGGGGGSNFSRTIYVDSKNGNDATATGQLDKMFKTLEGVVNAIGTTISLYSTITGDIQAGNTITNCSSVVNISIGQTITHANIPFGAVVANIVGSTITMSETMTASSGATIKIWTPYSVICQGNFNPDTSKNYCIDGIRWCFQTNSNLFVNNFKFCHTNFTVETNTWGFEGLFDAYVTGNNGWLYMTNFTLDVDVYQKPNTNIYLQCRNLTTTGSNYAIDYWFYQNTFHVTFSVNKIIAKNGYVCYSRTYANTSFQIIDCTYAFGYLGGVYCSGESIVINIAKLESYGYSLKHPDNDQAFTFNGNVIGAVYCNARATLTPLTINGYVSHSSTNSIYNGVCIINGAVVSTVECYVYGELIINGNFGGLMRVLNGGLVDLYGQMQNTGIDNVFNIESGGQLVNHSSNITASISMIWNVAGLLVNKGLMYFNPSALAITGGTIDNYGTMYLHTNANDTDFLLNNGTIINRNHFEFLQSYAGRIFRIAISGTGKFFSLSGIIKSNRDNDNGCFYKTGGLLQLINTKVILPAGYHLIATDNSTVGKTIQLSNVLCNVIDGVSKDKDGNVMYDEIGGTLIENINLI